MSKSNLNQSSLPTDAPWDTPWPASELERVSACPVCGSAERTVLHEGLIDNVFFVALGKWTLHSCTQCSSAYLDPRPSPASIGKAYGTYYTHLADVSVQVGADQLGLLRKVRRAVSNSYLNERFGTRRLPAYRWGFLLAMLFPHQRQLLDSEFRYLPKPLAGQRLLDIGCGNGAFLAKAKAGGWTVSGIDLDPKAVAAAASLGLDVEIGTVALFADESNCFDAITLSHVIEHVHEPITLLQDIFRLLRPGGVVYVETPNIESLGSKIYQKNWRGLETPRHLVLFNHKSLKSALINTGFEKLEFMSRKQVTKEIFRQSENMRDGRNPLDKIVARSNNLNHLADYFKFITPKKDELITIIVKKPS